MLVGAFDDQAAYGPVGVERMHSCQPVAGIGHESPKFRDRPPEVAGREWNSPMVCVRNFTCQRPWLVTVELVQRVDRALPYPRVRCRFSRKVPTIELLECGVEVIEIKCDVRLHPVVGVDFEQGECLGVERVRLSVSDGEVDPLEGEAIPASRKYNRRYSCAAEASYCPQVGDDGLAPLLKAGAHYPPTVVTRDVVGQS